MNHHPMGAGNPAALESVERMTRKLMPPRPEWNAVGPYITKRWRAALKRISPRLVLQYFPYGMLPGTSRQGFWAICWQMPMTKLLFKQSVMSLIDQFGRFQAPSYEMLAAIKRGMWKSKHEGITAEMDALDLKLDAADQKRAKSQGDDLYDSIMRSLTKLNPKMDQSRILVPG